MKSSLLALLILALAAPAAAQVQGGNIYGTVQDEQGGVLPGATVTLAGADRTNTATTETDGRFRFLNLPPGAYKLTISVPGFATVVRENIVLTVGQHVDLPFTLRVASLEQQVNVTAESPIVDTKATGTATNFTSDDLTRLPTSRDPWALLREVPGVMVDRVNIAGNETGQQSNFQAKGTRPSDAVWTMDGVVITDMAAVGASPTYFNYDNFEEIQVSTSGQDIRQSTGGVGLNLIVKRGTNQYRGMARGYFTSDGLEASNLPDELVARGITPELADHNQQISDYGFELGGPIVRDHAWAYGSWSDQDIRLFRRATSAIDRTKLKTYNVKGTWQATRNDLINVLWFLGDKVKDGRSPGTSGIVFDAPSATWHQGNAFEADRPHGLLKIEDNHTFGSSLFVSGRYAYYNTGFGLFPAGGLDGFAGESQVLGQSFGTTRQSTFLRPQHSVAVDGSHFRSFLGAGHEFKMGGGWRRADSLTNTIWPGNMIRALENSATDFRARTYRESLGTNRTEFFHLYVGDTMSFGPATVDLGVRYDRQWGSALPSSTLPNAAFPDLVPGIEFGGYRTPFTWNNVSPRAGITYALDADRRTIVRASFTRFAGQLESTVAGFVNPTASSNPGYVDYPWVDANGDHFAQADEVDTSRILSFGGGFNPAAPRAVTSVDVIDPDLKAPVTTTIVAGVDRELIPTLAVQASYSYTRTSNYYGTGNSSAYFAPWVGLTPADYAQIGSLTGVIEGTDIAYDVPLFAPDAGRVAANGNSRMLTNWPGYYSYYHGLEVSVVKRMANRWMARIGAAYNEPREHYDVAVNDSGNPTRTDLNPLASGGPYVIRSGGSGSGDIFVHARWQLNASGAYILPHDIQVAGTLFGREGYPFPVYRQASLGLDGDYRVLVSPEIDTFRLPNLWNLDLRLSKRFTMNRANVEFVADLFNVFNASTSLVRNRNAASPNFEQLSQNLSPRIVRFGVRLGF